MESVATRDIRIHIKELIKSSNEKQNMIAAKIGISEGYLSKFLSGKEINFWMVREIIRYLDPDNETELIKQYCLNGVKKKNYPAALEYCYAKRLFSVIENLIDRQIKKRVRSVRGLESINSCWNTDCHLEARNILRNLTTSNQIVMIQKHYFLS